MRSCFIIRRNKGETLYLSPFVDPKSGGEWDENEEICWHASTGLTAHEKDDALFTLYSQIDRGVDRWIQDKRYLPRLLLSAAIFLVTYFFFSLAVRDPLPMVDELLIATALSIGSALWLSKRDKKSEMAMKRKLELKQNASRSDFVIEDSLSVYEEYLDTCSYLETLDLADRLANIGEAPLPDFQIPEGSDTHLHQDLKKTLMRNIELQDRALFAMCNRVVEVYKSPSGSEALGARLVKLAMQKEIDLPLLALLLVVSKQ